MQPTLAEVLNAIAQFVDADYSWNRQLGEPVSEAEALAYAASCENDPHNVEYYLECSDLGVLIRAAMHGVKREERNESK